MTSRDPFVPQLTYSEQGDAAQDFTAFRIAFGARLCHARLP